MSVQIIERQMISTLTKDSRKEQAVGIATDSRAPDKRTEAMGNWKQLSSFNTTGLILVYSAYITGRGIHANPDQEPSARVICVAKINAAAFITVRAKFNLNGQHQSSTYEEKVKGKDRRELCSIRMLKEHGDAEYGACFLNCPIPKPHGNEDWSPSSVSFDIPLD